MKKIWIGIGIAVIVAVFIGINIYKSAAPAGGSAGKKSKPEPWKTEKSHLRLWFREHLNSLKNSMFFMKQIKELLIK